MRINLRVSKAGWPTSSEVGEAMIAVAMSPRVHQPASLRDRIINKRRVTVFAYEIIPVSRIESYHRLPHV